MLFQRKLFSDVAGTSSARCVSLVGMADAALEPTHVSVWLGPGRRADRPVA